MCLGLTVIAGTAPLIDRTTGIDRTRSDRPPVDDSPIPRPSGWDDPLTGLEGPVFWQRVLIAENARATKYARPVTVCVVEVEGIDAVVETDGEDAGRRVLRHTAQLLRREARASDYCARIDACRFGIVLTETDEITAINFVERVREAVPRSLPEVRGTVRFSFGWASARQREAPDSLVRRAERRLVAELTQ